VSEPVYYSKRLLNPFSGVVQILETDNARAISNDGINWQIQIQRQVFKSPWHELEFPAKYDRNFVYGIWSKSGELTRAPIHPTLYQEHVEQSAHDLMATLANYQNRIPFPQKDNYECWLLDRTKLRPVVLVNSSVDDNLPDFSRSMHWSPCEKNDTSFTTEAFLTRQEKATIKIHAKDILNEFIRKLTGASGIAIWVKRDENGHGHFIADNQKSRAPKQELFYPEEFPTLGIQQHWENDDEQLLISDYVQWLSPILLTLSGLEKSTRAQLEILAQQRPLLVDRYYYLYPEVIDETLLKKILVEARLRRSSGQVVE
jgi:hypothetical protein